MALYSRDMLAGVLKTNVLTVTFTKKDGTERVMKCTLKESYLPEKEKDTPSRKSSDKTLAVWDIEKKDWRSFTVDSVTNMFVGGE